MQLDLGLRLSLLQGFDQVLAFYLGEAKEEKPNFFDQQGDG